MNTQVNPSHYKAQSDQLKAEAISRDLLAKISTLDVVKKRGKVDLYNVEQVRTATAAYMADCAERGAVPTVVGLAGAFGVSRQWVNMFMREHPDTPSAQFLEAVKTNFADALIQSALLRHTSEAVSIFLLKNLADMSDRVEIEAVQSSGPLGALADPEDMQRRIMASIPADCDEN